MITGTGSDSADERALARGRIRARDFRSEPAINLEHLTLPCIYAISCVGTDDLYVGRALSLIERIGAHFASLRAGRCDSRKLQSLYDLHGASAIRFHVVEECDYCIQIERERFWIEKLCPSLNKTYATAERRRRMMIAAMPSPEKSSHGAK